MLGLLPDPAWRFSADESIVVAVKLIGWSWTRPPEPPITLCTDDEEISGTMEFYFLFPIPTYVMIIN